MSEGDTLPTTTEEGEKKPSGDEMLRNVRASIARERVSIVLKYPKYSCKEDTFASDATLSPVHGCYRCGCLLCKEEIQEWEAEQIKITKWKKDMMMKRMLQEEADLSS